MTETDAQNTPGVSLREAVRTTSTETGVNESSTVAVTTGVAATRGVAVTRGVALTAATTPVGMKTTGATVEAIVVDTETIMPVPEPHMAGATPEMVRRRA